jgi:CRISPR-associated protein Csh1
LLDALYEIGKTYIKKEGLDEVDILLDELKITKTVIFVEFELDNNDLTWIDVNIGDFSPSDATKYLYKKGSSRGTNITPSALITKTPTGTFDLKFIKWFQNEKSNDFVDLIYNELESNKEDILKKIEDIYSEIDTANKKNVLLTLSIKENGQRKFLNDFSIFKDHLKKVAGEKYYKRSSGPEMKGMGQCLLCDHNKEVMGLVANQSGLTFSTVDKPGNIQDLNESNQWKMVPICFECALDLEAGYKFIDKYLSFSEFGLQYYAIPRFLFKKDDVVNELFDYYLDTSESKSYYNTIVKREDEIIEDVETLDNLLEFKFFFYEKNNSAFNILGNVESVVPSWIRKLFEGQKYINKNPLFKEDFVKIIFNKKDSDKTGDFLELVNSSRKFNNVTTKNWAFGFLRDFFPVSRETNYTKFYIDLVSSIFSGKKINFDFILSYAMKKIRTYFRQDSEYFVKIFSLEFLMLFRFLKELDLLISYGDVMENENVKESFEKNNEELMNEYLNELDSPSKKASFLLGILTRKLLGIQYKELGSTPFTNKLWGLSLDEKKIRKLYPMVINKLNEYKIAYTDLAEDISLNLFESEKNWNLTRDETSYYFVLGYTLYRLYKKPVNG